EKKAAAPKRTESAQTGEGRSYGPTRSADSLWKIARNLKPSSSVSIQQTMVAIQRLNPDAFINGNINLLKKGKVIRGPSIAQARELTTREAISFVAQQNREWKNRISRKRASVAEAPQIDTSGRAVDNIPEKQVSTGAHLKLVSASDAAAGDNGLGGSGKGGASSMQGKLQVAEETADQFRLESEDLKVRNADLTEQLDTTDKVIGLKDEQIVALQARLAELSKEMERIKEQGAAGVVDSTADQAIEGAVDTAGIESETSAQDVMEGQETSAEVATTEGGVEQPVDFNYEEGAQVDVDQSAVDELATDELAKEDVPVVEEQPVQEDFLTMLLSNPLYLGAGGGVLLILIIGAMMAGRKKEDEVADSLVDDFNLEGVPSVDSDEAFIAEEELELDPFSDDVEDTAVAETDATVPQTADVIGEADIYLAYGRFPQAIEMLEKAAENEPDRTDIRVKLLEVAVEAADLDVFKRHESVLEDIGNADDQAKIAELRSKLSIESQEVVDDFATMDFSADESAVDKGAETGVAGTSDELSLDFDIEDETAVAVEETAEADVEESLDIDFSLDDELDLNVDSGEDEALEIDADLDVDVEPISDFAEADESLDVDLGIDSESTDTADLDTTDTTEESGGIEFDLDLDIDSSVDELALDSSSAEELAEELGQEGEFDLDVDAEIAVDTEEDATLIMPAAAEETPAKASAAEGADDLDFLNDSDEISTKLDLARAYIDMGDRDGAKDILDEVIIEGSDEQQGDAKELMAKLD
ncbi:MAG: hypothetical protein COA99_07205, partial [Moraxellaceae bacterium]